MQPFFAMGPTPRQPAIGQVAVQHELKGPQVLGGSRLASLLANDVVAHRICLRLLVDGLLSGGSGSEVTTWPNRASSSGVRRAVEAR